MNSPWPRCLRPLRRQGYPGTRQQHQEASRGLNEGEYVRQKLCSLFYGGVRTALSNRQSTRVLVVERRCKRIISDNPYTSKAQSILTDKGHRLTSFVRLVVNRSLGENSSLAGVDGVEHEAGAVLADSTRGQGTVDGVQDLRCTGVCVGSVHTARPGSNLSAFGAWCERVKGYSLEETDGHGNTLAGENREVRRAGGDSVASGTFGDTGSGVEEVEDELLFLQQRAISWVSGRSTHVAILEECDLCDLAGCSLQRGNFSRSIGLDRRDSAKGKGEEECGRERRHGV